MKGLLNLRYGERNEKTGIITIQSKNLGNRLQNYALQQTLREIGVESISIKRKYYYSSKEKCKALLSSLVAPIFLFDYYNIFPHKLAQKINKLERTYNFEKFNKDYIKLSDFYDTEIEENLSKIGICIAGSDQIWNPEFNLLTEADLLTFAADEKKFSYAASFGISRLPESSRDYFCSALSSFQKLSVREFAGKRIIEEMTGRNDVYVHPDPTLLLSRKQWSGLAKKPSNFKCKKYILSYFLGELDQSVRDVIIDASKKFDCEVISLLDKGSRYYAAGPRQFLFLEENAFLICTDSFHSSVFAFLFDKPFVVFDRLEKKKSDMNSRIDSFLSIYSLNDRKYQSSIRMDEYIPHDYSAGYRQLEKQKSMALSYLKSIYEDMDNGENRED